MGDFSAQFHRPESGIHTVEGNVAGSRAAFFSKKRQKEQEEFEERKRKIAMTAKNQTKLMDQKFSSDSTMSESEKAFRAKTVGLVSAEDFKRAQEERSKHSVDGNDYDQKLPSPEAIEKEEKAAKKKKKKRLKAKKKMMSTLSFATEEDELDSKEFKTSSLKDPTVDTSFLPDKDREQQKLQERRRLEQEWKQKQEEMKQEKLEIVYSYWDGSGHRRSVNCFKGDNIGEFLEKVRKDLCKEFRELQAISADALLYVKEDLIIPQDLTFYDLIATKARGKSGPLFHFGLKEDIRIGAIDSRVEKDESHPGKVIERRWYERNKHIFPASRWEIYDPKKDYGRYTIGGGEVTGKK